MPVAEIAAAVTGMRAALDITKAMVGLRDAEAFRAKSIELQSVVFDAFEKAIEAREAHTAQAERIRSLEAEVAHLKAWDAEKQNYELKNIGEGSVDLYAEARKTRHRTTALALSKLLFEGPEIVSQSNRSYGLPRLSLQMRQLWHAAGL